MNRFHTQSRNDSTTVPQGNGREGIGMEWRTLQDQTSYLTVDAALRAIGFGAMA